MKFARFGLAVLLSGCGKSDISLYRVPKETPGANQVSASGVSNGLRWQVPAGWAEKPAGGMRQASFAVGGKDGDEADVSVIALPGDAGGVLANVNRWRGQLGLAAIDEPALRTQASRLDSPAGKVLLVDLRGDADGSRRRLLAGILPAPGGTWFFKMSGREATVAGAKPAFGKFLRSLSFEKR